MALYEFKLDRLWIVDENGHKKALTEGRNIVSLRPAKIDEIYALLLGETLENSYVYIEIPYHLHTLQSHSNALTVGDENKLPETLLIRIKKLYVDI